MEQMDLSRLAGRVAVVTGAAGGLGSAITEDLCLSGLKVAAIDTNWEKLQALTARLQGSHASGSGSVHPMQADITQEGDLKRTFQTIDRELGAVAAIVNNAGVAPMRTLGESDQGVMSRVLDTNVLGLAAATREAIESMKKHGVSDGVVINIGSTVGHAESVSRALLDMFSMPMYIASKHAVIGFNRALRAELRNQGVSVRVTDLSPGTVETPLVDEEYLERLERRVMQPRDLARMVRFILSTPPHVEIVHLTVQPAGEVW
ncbi:Farnesol dehydrogenase [Frankliniella fusca]|uniref:Farnesol dehydrogenase n=1 Tax=Frankliniella fusca TaxID=407009 RepID=A0AAE1H0K9_9NEOP|nr:Farnesol dehydrogenase [Frankliniella fusca]